jgi:hypothetical protein
MVPGDEGVITARDYGVFGLEVNREFEVPPLPCL